jgi:hypothetical protein
MSKRLKLAGPSSSQPVAEQTKWQLCVICQQYVDTAVLKIPTTQGYETLAKNLSLLEEFNSLPYKIDISLLGDVVDIKDTLYSHNAKWHKACYDQCNAYHVERARIKHQKARRSAEEKPYLRTASCTLETEDEKQDFVFHLLFLKYTMQSEDKASLLQIYVLFGVLFLPSQHDMHYIDRNMLCAT